MQYRNINNFTDVLTTILKYGNNSGSVNIYMAHGGTNFGWTAGKFCAPFHMLIPHLHRHS